MTIDILMPALSPTMEEGALAKWRVKVGDAVRSGDIIAEIETDKAVMEVEAVDEGTIEAILVPEGTEGVKVNSTIAQLSGGVATSPAPAQAVAPVATPTPLTATAAAPAATASPAASSPRPAPRGPRIFASPLARRLAEQKGVDLAGLKGSGPHGRIVRADIDAATHGLRAPAAAAPSAAVAPRQAASLQQMGIPAGTYDLVPLDGMRKAIARRMTDSFRDVPHFPLNIDLEIDRLLEARSRINMSLKNEGVRVSVNDLVIKAAALALKRVPEANASYTPEGLAMHHHADVAMAVAVEGGLITPIIRQAELKGLAQISAEAKDLAERARTRKLQPDEFQGGTFTISNLGMFGIRSFASIINEPQGAILSVGAGEKRPVVRGDQLAVATVMTVTMTCDHRVVDGATGARWLQAFKGLIEDPVTMIL